MNPLSDSETFLALCAAFIRQRAWQRDAFVVPSLLPARLVRALVITGLA